MRLRARHYRTGRLIDVVCHAGRIAAVEEPSPASPDFEASWIAPAFCDIQINGCGGHSFNSPHLTPEQVQSIVRTCHAHGIAQLCPTLITGPFEALAHGFRTLAQVRTDTRLRNAIVGFHLEGPYIAAEDGPRGAHPRAHVRPPDWDEFRRWQDGAEGLIRIVTLAPELPGALDFIEKAARSGVVIALGHTAAKGPTLHDAIQAGARLSTHLGNGAHAMLPRHDNYIWEQLAADQLWASIIADGHHLPQSVLRCILRVKTPARLILTCDAGSLAGLPPGRYREWEQEFEVHPTGKIVVPGTGFLAGSWAFTDRCVATVAQLAELAWPDVLDMAGARPRELLGLPARGLEIGEPAEVVLFEEPFALRGTIVGEGRFAAD